MRFLLFFGMAWCEDRPGLMFAGIGLCIVLMLLASYPT